LISAAPRQRGFFVLFPFSFRLSFSAYAGLPSNICPSGGGPPARPERGFFLRQNRPNKKTLTTGQGFLLYKKRFTPPPYQG
jgi:hypothetical protein